MGGCRGREEPGGSATHGTDLKRLAKRADYCLDRSVGYSTDKPELSVQKNMTSEVVLSLSWFKCYDSVRALSRQIVVFTQAVPSC